MTGISSSADQFLQGPHQDRLVCGCTQRPVFGHVHQQRADELHLPVGGYIAGRMRAHSPRTSRLRLDGAARVRRTGRRQSVNADALPAATSGQVFCLCFSMILFIISRSHDLISPQLGAVCPSDVFIDFVRISDFVFTLSFSSLLFLFCFLCFGLLLNHRHTTLVALPLISRTRPLNLFLPPLPPFLFLFSL